ncbi:DUF418 domain-containing protein [Jeotgalibacillus haloalkalitolerans]|uniref:DUF418 domain-containing protein n=1 Tax=Jeotgalibacillus haloalkalitolerans TaxID=3104292 RepID=A0ABU5KN58_9BACL|nr:DUF418 domain-containing protein [Jeotgalibacillus sp. HH7-29]MDZ5712600.1 DUF418 domain-containing protein [Jeotgalibacillus sp. HH7-29]
MSSVSMKERIHTLDIIRGFALFGILIANMVTFKTPAMTDISGMVEGNSLPEGGMNAALTLLTAFFVDAKFYPMFSMLFGLGFYIFYSRLMKKGLPAKKLFRRRLMFLMLMGLVHLIFIWSGDILHTYAITGFLLPFFVERSTKTIKIWAISLLVFGPLLMTALMLLSSVSIHFMISGGMDTLENLNASSILAASVMAEGSFGEILAFRFTNEVLLILAQFMLLVPTILPLFLIGLYLGKTGMFTDIENNLHRWKKIMWIGLAVGAPIVGLAVAIDYNVFGWPPYLAVPIAGGLNTFGGPFLMLFYVSVIVLFTRKAAVEKVLMPFASVGRMALTNYLMQSVIAVIIFNGYGFGLFGQVSKTAGVLIAIAIYSVQVLLSHVLLKRYNQGPMEYVWRKWTYSGGERHSKAA